MGDSGFKIKNSGNPNLVVTNQNLENSNPGTGIQNLSKTDPVVRSQYPESPPPFWLLDSGFGCILCSAFFILQFRFFLVLLSLVFMLSSCGSGLIRQQEKQIILQQEEIDQQKREIEALKLAKQNEEKKRSDCYLAFRDFEKAQTDKDSHKAISLYRQGLSICPDDDVAHYELGKILRGIGQTKEAEKEFEEALKINPNFTEAKRQLEAIRNR